MYPSVCFSCWWCKSIYSLFGSFFLTAQADTPMVLWDERLPCSSLFRLISTYICSIKSRIKFGYTCLSLLFWLARILLFLQVHVYGSFILLNYRLSPWLLTLCNLSFSYNMSSLSIRMRWPYLSIRWLWPSILIHYVSLSIDYLKRRWFSQRDLL